MESVSVITNEERLSGRIDSEKVRQCGTLLERHGYLVLRNVVAAEPLDRLRDFLDDEWSRFQRSKDKWMSGGRLIGHLQILPPTTPDLIVRDILLNRIIFQITRSLLGQDVRNVQYGGNANLPGSVSQDFHADTGPEGNLSLIINLPLGSVDEGNGSLEIIPQSHDTIHSSRDIDDFRKRGRVARVNTQSGDAIIRYPTLVHRGTPNPSSAPRYMLAMWHVPGGSTMDKTMPSFTLDVACRAIIGDDARRLKCRFEDQPIRHFNPNYFAPNLLGLAKELMFLHTPGLFGLAKRLLR